MPAINTFTELQTRLANRSIHIKSTDDLSDAVRVLMLEIETQQGVIDDLSKRLEALENVQPKTP